MRVPLIQPNEHVLLDKTPLVYHHTIMQACNTRQMWDGEQYSVFQEHMVFGKKVLSLEVFLGRIPKHFQVRQVGR